VYASLYSSRLTQLLPGALPGRLAHAAHESVGAALGAAGGLAHAGQPALGGVLHDAASSAFFHGFSTANLLAAGVAAGGAVMALALLPARPSQAEEDANAHPAPAAAEPLPALE
jgi:hypothetical protein